MRSVMTSVTSAVFCVFFTGCACMFGCGGPSGGGERSEAPDRMSVPLAKAEPVDIPGMGNPRRLGDDLLFGGQPPRETLELLAAQGYRTVVSTRGTDELDWSERALVESLGMQYVELPMAYPIEEIPDEWVESFDDLMKEAERPMLVHCSSGNRVGGLYAVWLVEREGVDVTRALQMGTDAGMTRIRPVVENRLGAGAP